MLLEASPRAGAHEHSIRFKGALVEQRHTAANTALPRTRKELREAQLAQQQVASEVVELAHRVAAQARQAAPEAKQVAAAQPVPKLTRAMLRAQQAKIDLPNPELAQLDHAQPEQDSTFDRVPVLNLDLSDPTESMCAEHTHEAKSRSHRDAAPTIADAPTRASLRAAAELPTEIFAPVTDAAFVASLAAPAARPKKAKKAKSASRLAVLASLAIATVATPVALAGTPLDEPALAEPLPATTPNVGPSTTELVNTLATAEPVPQGIAQQRSENDRVVHVASRSDERTALSDCDPTKAAPGENGELRKQDLCEVLENHALRADAAVGFAALNEAYTERFGKGICLTDSYRPLSVQRTLKWQKGSLAATPGRSNHGWGLAVDICNTSYQAADKWEWMNANAPRYGWAQPSWASRSYEPWHWEFTAGVEAN